MNTGRRAGSQSHASSVIGVERRHIRQSGFDIAADAPRMVRKGQPGLGRAHGLANPFYEANAQLLLQLAHLKADGRLTPMRSAAAVKVPSSITSRNVCNWSSFIFLISNSFL